MDCAGVRKRLTRGMAPGGALAEHLRSCTRCPSYALRLDRVRRGLGEHHAGVTPDAAFADRVAAALPRATENGLGAAALKILPAAVVLAALLTWWALRVAPDPGSLLLDSSAEDLLSWVAGVAEAGS